MIAVIKTGGKQYLVSPGDKIEIEKLKAAEGSEVVFDKVLLVENKGKVRVGKPFVKGAEVLAKVLEQKKSKKIIIFKYKAKKRYKKKAGHRQPVTKVEILKVSTST